MSKTVTGSINVIGGIAELFNTRQSNGRDRIQVTEYREDHSAGFVALGGEAEGNGTYITLIADTDTILIDTRVDLSFERLDPAVMKRLQAFFRPMGAEMSTALPSLSKDSETNLNRLKAWLQSRPSKGRDDIKRVWSCKGPPSRLRISRRKKETFFFEFADYETEIRILANAKFVFGLAAEQFKIAIRFFEEFYDCEFA
jgi:hypothetical protein